MALSHACGSRLDDFVKKLSIFWLTPTLRACIVLREICHNVRFVTGRAQMIRRIPEKTVARLSLYRRIMRALLKDGRTSIFSHELADLALTTAAQVRRDIMSTGYSGNPQRGYTISRLMEAISAVLDGSRSEEVALVGVGNLGMALLAYFAARQQRLTITAAFDSDPYKAGRVIKGCRCWSITEINEVLSKRSIRTAIIAVPASRAQKVADMLAGAGVSGILNFAPVRLRVSDGIYVENMDMTASIEKVAYFSRQNAI